MTAIISPNIRVRCPEHFEVGAHSVIDDYSYFSTRVRVGRCSHIASGCTVGGGADREFRLGDFSSISAGVRIWCSSEDFTNDLVAIVPTGGPAIKRHLITGDVLIGDFTVVGANSVVMPGNTVPVGVAIGALSFVPPRFAFEPWSVYAGTPIRYLKPRNEREVRDQAARLQSFLGSS